MSKPAQQLEERSHHQPHDEDDDASCSALNFFKENLTGGTKKCTFEETVLPVATVNSASVAIDT